MPRVLGALCQNWMKTKYTHFYHKSQYHIKKKKKKTHQTHFRGKDAKVWLSGLFKFMLQENNSRKELNGDGSDSKGRS